MSTPRDKIEAKLGLTGPPLQKVRDVPPAIPDHELVRRIGQGAYGEVWLARNALGTWRAVKIVYRDTFKDARPYEREFAGIRRFEPLSRSNEGFVDVLQVGRNDADGWFYYVMELADAAESSKSEIRDPNEIRTTKSEESSSAEVRASVFGIHSDFELRNSDLYQPRTLARDLHHRGRLPLEDCLQLGLNLSLALGHLHRHGLIHRDVKPSNIIYVGGVPKLADIGLVTEAQGANTFVGTEGFVPPEGPISPQADLYALGKVLYEAAMGKDRNEFPEPFTQISADKESVSLMELNAVLLRACAPDPRKRYASAEGMHADLALLYSGGSVKRRHQFDRQFQIAKQVGAVAISATLLIGAALLWQRQQTQKMTQLAGEKAALATEKTKLASENLTLAQKAQANAAEARQNELVARQNLYAADINLAQRALLADNLRQARVILQNQLPKPGEPDLRGFEWRYLWQQCQGDELFSLAGHKGGAWRVAFSPDGGQLATGGADGATKLWDLASRREIASLESTGGILSVSFSPKGDFLATASEDESWLWNVRSHSRVRQLPGGRLQAKFSPDGKYLLTVSTNGLLLWETANWRIAKTLQTPEPRSRTDYQAAFAPDGKRVAVVFNEAIRLLSIPDLQETGVLPQKRSTWPVIGFSPDNSTVATHAGGFGVKLWDTTNKRESKTLAGHVDTVFAARFSPDGKRVAACSSDQTIKVWEVATGELVRTFKGQADEIFDVAFSPDGKMIASVGWNDGIIKLWDATAKTRQENFREPFGPVGFDLDGSLVAFDEKLRPVVLDPATLQTRKAQELSLTEGRDYAPYLGHLSSDGRTLVMCMPKDHQMEVWDRNERKRLCSVPSTSLYVCFAPKRQLLITVNSTSPTYTGSTNQIATVWQLPEGKPKWAISNIWHVPAISPDETLLIADEGKAWKLWKIGEHSLTPLLTFGQKVNPSYEKSAAFSPDGSLLAIGEIGGVIKLWAMPSVREIGTLSGHSRDETALAFSPDGRTLASICDDRTVRLWHVSTRRELLHFQAAKEDKGKYTLAFSPDGRALAARRIDTDGPITWVWYGPSLAEIAQRDKLISR